MSYIRPLLILFLSFMNTHRHIHAHTDADMLVVGYVSKKPLVLCLLLRRPQLRVLAIALFSSVALRQDCA